MFLKGFSPVNTALAVFQTIITSADYGARQHAKCGAKIDLHMYT